MSGKTYAQYIELLRLQARGKGDETVMFVIPNAPTHIEHETIIIIEDEFAAMLDSTTPRRYFKDIEKEVKDYPTATVNEAIRNFEDGKSFWGK